MGNICTPLRGTALSFYWRGAGVSVLRGNDCQELREMKLCSGGEEGNLCVLSLQAMWKVMQVS